MDTVARKFYNKHKDEANEELPITPWEDVIARKPEALKYPCMCLQFCAKEPVEQSYVTAAQRLGFYRVLRLIQGHNFNFYGFFKKNFMLNRVLWFVRDQKLTFMGFSVFRDSKLTFVPVFVVFNLSE